MESSGRASSSSAPRKRKRKQKHDVEMEMDLSGASSSSSAPRIWKHEVFLSFRGEDTRHGFTGNLYDDLVKERLNVYMDDQKLPIGKAIRPELLQAIEESKSAIVILSKNYADSTWCLDELAKIVETRDLILYPVFYRVDPSDVRSQRNEFDLTKYERDPRISKDRLNSWRSALQKVGNAAGLHVEDNRKEGDVRDEIVRKISEQLEEKMKNLGFLTTDIVLLETFDANCNNVLEYLKNDKVSSIGIYGMGGVGKTTVMKHVHNQILADPDSFGDVYWVPVSQDFSIRRLQDDIYRKLKHKLPREEWEDSEECRAVLLSDILTKKGKCILILDDVWKDISLVKVGIPVGVSLCRLIVTTRSLDVCNRLVCQKKINISPLLWEEAWELFKKINLGQDEEFTAPEVETTAKDVAKRCGGLPLAIKTMAGSMRGVSDIHEWRNALEDLKKPETFTISDMGSEVLSVLIYSYNHLPDEESQQCFLSCALYPKDYITPREELIHYCIVKGLIKKKKKDSRRAEIDKGHTTLNILIRCCLLEAWYDDEHVTMHDLVRKMALHIIKSKKHQEVMVKGGFELTEIPEEEEWTEDLEVVSLVRTVISEIPDGRSPRCPKLLTAVQ